MANISADALIKAATEQTGLSDFGEELTLEGFHKFVAAVNNRPDFLPDRQPRLEQNLQQLLENKLRYQRDLKQHPEINDQPLLPPVAIVSLPRTGTTKLQRMLSSTNQFQDLMFWQSQMPARITELPDNQNIKF